MGLQAGTRLGPYEITGAIGAGGMGEVYKARDTRLNRTVAIKVLPATLAADREFRERFDREARVLSGLDHPHICGLYDVGEHDGIAFLVMPLLDGHSLATRLERGPLPIAEALEIAAQVSDALDKAHRAGIVHRDLKPANVMLTKSGAKLLDFGLAKDASALPRVSTSMATMSKGLTAQGSILGTLQYMAPEQLEAAEADARTDIFALGAVLYEMVTGRKAFEASSQASLIAAILERQPPPVSAIQPVAPAALDRVVRKCLAKAPDDRWQSARDLRDELRWIAGGGAVRDVTTAIPAKGASRPWIVAGVAMAIALAAIAFAASRAFAPRPQEPPAFVSQYQLPRGIQFGFNSTGLGRLAVSPDGRRIVFSGQEGGGRRRLWMRRLDSLTAEPLAGTDRASAVFWSPDSRFLAFQAEGKLKRMDIAGGVAVPLAEVASRFRGTWSASDVIYSGARNATLDLFRKAASGTGEASLVLGGGGFNKYVSDWSPDGKSVLYFSGIGGSQKTQQDIYLLPLTHPSTPVPLVQTKYEETNGRFSPPDGRWVAFQSSESGRDEIYLTPATPGGIKYPVTSSGGVAPCWRPDGKELFYVSEDRKLTAVTVDLSASTPVVGQPHPLFELHVRAGAYIGFYAGSGYDVVDNTHFLLNGLSATAAADAITIVVNWPALIRK